MIVQSHNFIKACQPFINVSHETFNRLKTYAALVQEWQPRINLISPTTLPDIWHRHIYDSAQVAQFIQADDSVLDLGSGGGFPGMVLAILTDRPFTLVESDQRKCAFLNEVVRQTKAPVSVLNKRIEALDPALLPATLVTARAFAPLPKMLTLSSPWLQNGARGLFPKGKAAVAELQEASTDWSFTASTYPSLSDPEAAILIVEELRAR